MIRPMSLRLLWLLAVLLPSACATTLRPAPCPTVAMTWTARPWPKKRKLSFGPCVRDLPTEGSNLTPFGRDLDQALYCVEQLYRGPDDLPTERMLAGALNALARVYPTTRTSVLVNHAVLQASTHAGAAPMTIDALTALLLRVAVATRLEVPRDAIAQQGSPEDLLIGGALAALQWPTMFIRPPIPKGDGKRPFTASTRDGIAYVRVPQLESGAVRLIRSQLAARWVSGVILDLRGSPGGWMEEAIKLADLFLRDGCLVAFRTAAPNMNRAANLQGDDIDAPIVVLVDHGTVSGSELVATTLRARGRAIIVGERTFGNAMMHTVLRLESGAFLKVPVAEILAADGTPFLGRGVEPDVTVPALAPSDALDDAEINLAKQILRRARGRGRDALLRAANVPRTP